jgi:hypothetical protein
VYVFTHIFHTTGTRVGQKKYNKTWDSSERREPRKSIGVPFWARVPKVRQSWAIHHTERDILAPLTITVSLPGSLLAVLNLRILLPEDLTQNC